jgi:addiction module RelB/DinJ family antitoxin
MPAKTLVQVRVDSEVKKSAEKILGSYGLDIPTLFRMALHATINTEGVPFPVNKAMEDYYDFQTADRSYAEFVKSGKKANSIHKLAEKIK